MKRSISTGPCCVPHVNETLFLAPSAAFHCVKHGPVEIERFIVQMLLQVHIGKLVKDSQSFHIVSV
jgi:hypothetical protein